MPILTKHLAPIGLVVVGLIMALAFSSIAAAGASENEVVIKSVHFDLGNADTAGTEFGNSSSTADPGVADFSFAGEATAKYRTCLLYTSPSPRDATLSRMPSSA